MRGSYGQPLAAQWQINPLVGMILSAEPGYCRVRTGRRSFACRTARYGAPPPKLKSPIVLGPIL